MSTNKAGPGGIGHNSGKRRKSAKERQQDLYKRRREAGWKKSWVDPGTHELASTLGGIEKIPEEVERLRSRVGELEQEVSDLEDDIVAQHEAQQAQGDPMRWLGWPLKLLWKGRK